MNIPPRRRFLRGLLLVGGLFIAFFLAEFMLEWLRLGKPGLADLSWAGNNNAKLVDVLSPMARAYNNILAMLIATIGLAIPLTASMYTPKLIEMFLRDPINWAMIGFLALGAANVLFTDYLIGPRFAPMWAFRVAVFGAILGWAALVPYFFYVVRFLDPSRIITRLHNDVLRQIDRAERRRQSIELAHETISERLHQLGTLVIKSVDRFDRGVALEGIWSLKRILDRYGERKQHLPDAWFEVDRKDFAGLSVEALQMIGEERTWFEHKTLGQMLQAYRGAVARTADVISSISDATRVVAVHAALRGDDKAVEVAVRFFNSFLREAVKRKDTLAVYDLFYQYRLLGWEARDRPQLLERIGRHFRFYGELALQNGIEFAADLAGFDLGWLVRRAYESRHAAAAELLEQMLSLCPGAELPRLVAARLMLGGFFLEQGFVAEAERVRTHLADVSVETINRAADELGEASERCYWEVTDRQVNFEWMPPARRPHVRTFVDSLIARANNS